MTIENESQNKEALAELDALLWTGDHERKLSPIEYQRTDELVNAIRAFESRMRIGLLEDYDH